MQCHEIRMLLPVRGELSWTQQQELQAHLRGCAACAAEAAQVERTQRALQLLTADRVADRSGPPEQVRAAIRARLDRGAGRWPRAQTWKRGMLVTGVVLAVALLVAALERETIIARVRMLGWFASPPMQLYLTQPDGQIMPIDPQTLTEIEGAAPLTLDTPTALQRSVLLLSADATTIAVIGVDPTPQPDNARTVTILDAPTRTPRGRFLLPQDLQSPQLSDDGSRLAALHCAQANAGVTCDVWHVFDTGDGRLLSTIPHEQPFYRAWLSPSGGRLYLLRLACLEDCAAPRPPVLLSYDTATGTLAGQLELREVLAGVWPVGETAWGGALDGMAFPGVALSPDGRRIAIVHADQPLLTLVDAVRMELIETRRLSGAVAWPDQGVPHPQGSGGFELHAVFSDDGRSLFVIGSEHGFDAADGWIEQRKGLRIIDVQRAEVRGDVLVGQWVGVLGATPEALYLSSRPEQRSTRYTLSRLDMKTLEITAARPNLSQSQVLRLLPAETTEQP